MSYVLMPEAGRRKMGLLLGKTSSFARRSAGRLARNVGLAPVHPPRRIIFFHMPKCAGTSVRFAIEEAMRRKWPLWSPNIIRIDSNASEKAAAILETDRHSVRETLMLYALHLPRHHFISGHAPVTERTLAALKDTDLVVTVLRHPYKRVLSSYYFNVAKGTKGTTEYDIEAWLDRVEPSPMTAFFGGTFETAVRHIQGFDVIGFMDDLAAFEAELGWATSLPIRLKRRNKTGISYLDFDAQPSSVKAKIREICEQDLELYQAVRGGA